MRKKKDRYSRPIQWVGSYAGTAFYMRNLASYLRTAGLKARTTQSIYVGLRILQVAKEDANKARVALRQIQEDYIAGCI